MATNRQKISYPIRGHFNCLSHVAYVMTCDICQIQYVGETNLLNTRCSGHESIIRTEADHPVAHHYNTYAHTLEETMDLMKTKDYDWKMPG